MSISRLKYYGPALMLLALGCPGSGQKLPAEDEDSAGDTAAVVDSGDSGEVVAPDADGDGSPDSEDCYPDDPTKSPLQHELCNGEDDDCDGLAEPYCGSSMADYQIEGSYSGQGLAGALFFLDDLDGDGRDDLLVGTTPDISKFCYGRDHYVLLTSSLPQDGAFKASIDEVSVAYLLTDETLCPVVLPIGDVDGDGLADLVVEDLYTSEDGPSAVVLTGSQILRGGAIDQSDAEIQPDVGPAGAGGSVGMGVGRVGDIDGDGVDEVGYGLGESGRADLSIVRVADIGATDFQWQHSRWTVASSSGSDSLSLTGGGDTDGDGLDDILVYYESCDESGGASCEKLVLGADFPTLGAIVAGIEVTTYVAGETATIQIPQPGEDRMGDFDGDGLDEVVIEVVDSSASNPIYIELAGPRGDVRLGEAACVLVDGAEVQHGPSVSLAGDVNRDGSVDLLVSFGDERTAVAFSTGVMLVSGAQLPSLGVVEAPLEGWAIYSDEEYSVGSAFLRNSGDFDGDGVLDLLMAGGPARLFSGAGFAR